MIWSLIDQKNQQFAFLPPHQITKYFTPIYVLVILISDLKHFMIAIQCSSLWSTMCFHFLFFALILWQHLTFVCLFVFIGLWARWSFTPNIITFWMFVKTLKIVHQTRSSTCMCGTYTRVSCVCVCISVNSRHIFKEVDLFVQ